MGYRVRDDQVDKVLAYIEEHIADETLVSIGVKRKVGKNSYRQIGDAYSKEELDALATGESILEAVLADKCKGIGSWQLQTYRGSGVGNQPIVNFETTAQEKGERAAGGDTNGAALRDLSVQLRMNADMTAKRLDESMERLTGTQEKMLDLVMGYGRAERAAQAEDNARVLDLTIKLVKSDLENQMLRTELENARKEAAGTALNALIEKMPPDALAGIVVGAFNGIAELGKAHVEKVRAQTALATAEAKARAERVERVAAAAAPKQIREEAASGEASVEAGA